MFQRRTQDPLPDEATSTKCTSDSVLLGHESLRDFEAVVVRMLTPLYSYAPSQADVAVFKALSSAPDAEKYPHAARWYGHVATYESEFATLPGDASKAYTTYGPDVAEVTINPAKAPEKEGGDDDDDVDLFGSDEEDDAEAARVREERLEAYRKKKEAKPKVAAKSVVTMDVKPWGMWNSKLPPASHCF